MADLDLIAADIRRQRKEIDDFLESTSSRCDEATGLLARIEELRRRAEKTQQSATPGSPEPPKK